MITVKQNNDVYEIRFRYDPTLLNLVKQVPGRQWNPEQKFWSIPLSSLGMLMNQLKGTMYESMLQLDSEEHINENAEIEHSTPIPDYNISKVPFLVKKGSTPYKHQLDFMKWSLFRENVQHNMSGFILADDQGCIAGNQEVWINEFGKPATRPVSLRRFKELWEQDNTIKIKSLVDGRFQYCNVSNVLYKGRKHCLKITAGNYSIVCTDDHEILTNDGWRRADNLHPGDIIMVNGVNVCKRCGSSEDLITYEHAKFLGYCRKCMYELREGTKYRSTDGIVKQLDEDGYVRLKGYSLRFHPLYKDRYGMGIYEHWYVWYEHTGHIVDPSKEAIHHKNHDRTDNRIENLELLSLHDHARFHSEDGCTHLPQFNKSLDYVVRKGKTIYYVPQEARISEVSDYGDNDVYDVSIQDAGIHNFVANGVVVHNCGKTIELSNLAVINKMAYRFKRCLIICCVNPAKYHWEADIETHLQGKFEPYILGSRFKKNGEPRYDTGSKEKLEDLVTLRMHGDKKGKKLPYFIIMNVEGIRHKSGRSYPIADAIIDLINKREISMIAIDEVHKNTSPSSMQGKQLLRIKKATGRKCMWIPLTGTPITSKPTDVFLPLKLVDGHNFSSFYTWCQKFCVYGGFGGHEIVAYKNIPYLKELLEKNMIRRLKSEVLDLPPKIHYTEYVENTVYQQKLYNDVLNGIMSEKLDIVASLNPLARFLRLRQVNGSPELIDNSLKVDKKYLTLNAKMGRLLDLLEEIHDRGEKVIVFSSWVEPLRTIYRVIGKKYNVATYTGTMKGDDREAQKQKFINDPKCTVILGTIGALGTMHTLTVARNVIFYDEPWNATDKAQAEDRAYRIGTTSSVNIYTLITKGTIDERVHNILYTKDGISKYIVDGSLDIHSNPELFDLLLSDTVKK